MQYSKELARIKREKEESLQKNLQAAQIQYQQNQCEEIEKANGLIVRSRRDGMNMGKRVLSIF